MFTLFNICRFYQHSKIDKIVQMGNNPTSEPNLSQQTLMGRRVTEMSLTDANSQAVYEQIVANQSVCCFTYQKTSKSIDIPYLEKIVWQSKFITNCQMLIQDFGWAGELVEIVKTNQLPKLKYYREIHQLKRDKASFVTKNQSEVTTTPEDIEKFKKNLKKSVIISFAPQNKATEMSTIKSTMIGHRSRLERRDKNGHSSVFYREKSKSGKSQHSFKKSNSSRSSLTCVEAVPNEKDVSKETCIELQIFLKFSNILERHLSDMSCVLGRLKKCFVDFFQRHYKDSATACKQLDYIIESTQQFLQLLRDAIMDYYNLSTFSPPSEGNNMFISNDDNILSTITAIVFRDHNFYNCLFNLTAYQFRQRQLQFNKILNHLKTTGPQKFTVKDKFCLNWLTIKSYIKHLSEDSCEDNIVENIEINDIVVEHSEPYRVCMNHLNQMAKSRAPVNKLKSIMACSQGITVEIQKFYQMNGLKKQKWMLDADQVLSIFCYLIVGARVQHLHTHLFILDNFASSHQMISMTGYYLSVIRCAVQQLENQFSQLLSSNNSQYL